jgi:hypothetical protein
MSLAPVPAEGFTCSNCSAPLVTDQRYCLSCGQPCSPVRLAFLDVLQGEGQSQATQRPLATGAVTYAPLLEPAGPPNWLRRYSPLFGVMTVLLLATITGLLVGHWVTQSKAPGPEVIKIEGLTAPVAAAASTTPTPAVTSPAKASEQSTESSAAEEAAETVKEAKAEKAQALKVEKAKPHKETAAGLKKLGSSTGKKHKEEIEKLGNQPIETG